MRFNGKTAYRLVIRGPDDFINLLLFGCKFRFRLSYKITVVNL